MDRRGLRVGRGARDLCEFRLGDLHGRGGCQERVVRGRHEREHPRHQAGQLRADGLQHLWLEHCYLHVCLSFFFCLLRFDWGFGVIGWVKNLYRTMYLRRYVMKNAYVRRYLQAKMASLLDTRCN